MEVGAGTRVGVTSSPSVIWVETGPLRGSRKMRLCWRRRPQQGLCPHREGTWTQRQVHREEATRRDGQSRGRLLQAQQGPRGWGGPGAKDPQHPEEPALPRPLLERPASDGGQPSPAWLGRPSTCPACNPPAADQQKQQQQHVSLWPAGQAPQRLGTPLGELPPVHTWAKAQEAQRPCFPSPPPPLVQPIASSWTPDMAQGHIRRVNECVPGATEAVASKPAQATGGSGERRVFNYLGIGRGRVAPRQAPRDPQ